MGYLAQLDRLPTPYMYTTQRKVMNSVGLGSPTWTRTAGIRLPNSCEISEIIVLGQLPRNRTIARVYCATSINAH